MANKSNSLVDTSSLERDIDGVGVWAVWVDGGGSGGGGREAKEGY